MWFRLISDGGIVGSSWQPATVTPAAAFQELYVEPSLNTHLGDLRKVKSQRWRDANSKPNSSTNDHDNWPWLNRRLRSRDAITTEANSPIKRPAIHTKTYWRPSAVIVYIHNNESFWNGCEIFTWTKAKSRQQVHQNGRLQKINCAARQNTLSYHLPTPIQFRLRQCNRVSALTIKPWLGAERLFLVSDLTVRLEYE